MHEIFHWLVTKTSNALAPTNTHAHAHTFDIYKCQVHICLSYKYWFALFRVSACLYCAAFWPLDVRRALRCCCWSVGRWAALSLVVSGVLVPSVWCGCCWHWLVRLSVSWLLAWLAILLLTGLTVGVTGYHTCTLLTRHVRSATYMLTNLRRLRAYLFRLRQRLIRIFSN